MTKSQPCHYSPDGWVTPEHLRDCDSNSCTGCKPCNQDHCGIRTCATHIDHATGTYTCPTCIGRTRRQIERIAARHAELPDEYEYAGVDSEIVNLHGPAAYPGQWSERRSRLITAYAERGWCDFPQHGAMAPDDAQHPYAVLGRWDMTIREIYNQPTDLFINVTRAADYLAGKILDTFAHTQEFEDFARDIATCLTHLDEVLALARRPEQGAPCPTCRVEFSDTDRKAARLEKRLAEHFPKIPPGKVCDTDDCRTCSGDMDTWHCPINPEHHWGHVDYRTRVDGDYVEHATELPATELANRIGVALSTFRKWTARSWNDQTREYDPPRLVSRRRDSTGRKVYRVQDAVDLAIGRVS